MQRFSGLVTTCTGIGYLTRSFFKAVTASFVNGSSVVPTYRFSRLPGVAPWRIRYTFIYYFLLPSS